MRRMSGPSKAPLAGTRIAITRPAGSGAALARRARALGGEALSLPGSSLREAADPRSARSALAAALAADIAILTSPAAVRFAARLRALRTRAVVLAPGRGTAQALRRAGLRNPVHPGREDSEGLLALPVLRHVRGKRIGIVGAAGGRGLLQRELAARGARIIEAQVYRRVPARLDRRHAAALLRHPRRPLFVLLSSAEALDNLRAALPGRARRALLAGTAVVSSARMETLAREAGFVCVLRAGSARGDDLLAAVLAHRRPRRTQRSC